MSTVTALIRQSRVENIFVCALLHPLSVISGVWLNTMLTGVKSRGKSVYEINRNLYRLWQVKLPVGLLLIRSRILGNEVLASRNGDGLILDKYQFKRQSVFNCKRTPRILFSLNLQCWLCVLVINTYQHQLKPGRTLTACLPQRNE